jgi:hypothetical protein
VRTLNYPDYVFYAAQNFGGSLKEGTVFKSFSDLEKLKPGSSKGDHIYTKSFFVPRVIRQNEITQLHAIFRDQPEAVRCRLEAYSGAVNDVKPGDTAFVHRQQVGYNARATIDYAFIKDNGGNRTANRWLQRFFDTGSTIFGTRETYQNYVDIELTDYLQRYYGGNLKRLVEVKRRYDPDNYFKNPQSIPTR